LIYDYTLLTSFLFASLLILIIGYTKLHIKRLIDQKSSQGKAENQVYTKRIEFETRLIFFILLVIFLTRFACILFFPYELKQLLILDSFFSLRYIFLTLQGIIILSYVYLFFRILISMRFLEEYRYIYLNNALNAGALFIFFEIILSIILYSMISMDLILSDQNQSILYSESQNLPGISETTIFLLLSLFIFIYFFLRIQKRRNPFNFMGYVITHLSTILISIYFTHLNLPYFFDPKSLLYSGLDVYRYTTGYSGWVWLFILCMGLASQLFGFLIIRNKNKFINRQIAMNYTIQLSRIILVSVLGVSIIALLPSIFVVIINLQR